jgi:hypothetical protein
LDKGKMSRMLSVEGIKVFHHVTHKNDSFPIRFSEPHELGFVVLVTLLIALAMGTS